jgi:hypothetical protein
MIGFGEVLTVDSVLFPSLHIQGNNMKTNTQIVEELKRVIKKKEKKSARRTLRKSKVKLKNKIKKEYKEAVDNFFIKLENI